MSMTAETLYGVPPSGYPSGATMQAPNPSVSVGSPTTAIAGRPHLLASPAFWVVLVLAAAIGLIHASFRLS